MANQKSTETLGTGLRAENGVIVIDFRWCGKRYRPTTDLKPTKQGINAATKIRGSIVSEIKSGVFSKERFAYFFPNHPIAEEFKAEVQESAIAIPSFTDVALNMLDLTKRSISDLTLKQYKSLLNTWWMPYLAELPITEIDEDLLETIDASLEWPSEKTRNNALIPLRRVFDRAMKMRLMIDGKRTPIITFDPCDCLQNGKINKSDPDPFTPQERELILGHLYRNISFNPIWYHYFIVAFYTGMRTGEIQGLHWEQIDFNEKTILVDRVVSAGKIRIGTKTNYNRTIPMLPIVETAIKAMRQYTQINGKHVFALKGDLDTPILWPKPASKHFQGILKKLGIRARPTYNTRHTFATTMLMDNVKPGAAAKIMGHSLYVFFTTYAKWLDSEETHNEIRKVIVNDPSESIKISGEKSKMVGKDFKLGR